MKKGLQKTEKQIVLVLIWLLLVAWCISPVAAISVSGAKYMGSIAPGKTDNHIITVSLGANEKATDIQIDVLGFGQGIDQDYVSLNPEDDIGQYSGRKFITLSKSTVHLEPGSAQEVKATISLPQNVGSGGRYALISVHALGRPGDFITTAVTIPVLITVSGTEPVESGSIVSVDTGDVIIGQPIKITTTLKNTGDIHYYFTQNVVTIRDTKGNLVGNYSSPPSIYAILPGNTVHYNAKPTIQNLPIGTYTADSKIVLGDGRVLDEKSATFEVKTDYVPPITEASIELTPGSAATLSSPDGRYIVSFPQGAVLGDGIVTLKPYSIEKLQKAPPNAKLGATSFEITGLTGLLSKDAIVKVTYTSDDLTAAGGDASQLKLAYFDTAQNAWVILPTQVDSQAKTLTSTTNHLSVWAIMVSSTTSDKVPSAQATKSPLPVILILASLALAVIAAKYHDRQRK